MQLGMGVRQARASLQPHVVTELRCQTSELQIHLVGPLFAFNAAPWRCEQKCVPAPEAVWLF